MASKVGLLRKPPWLLYALVFWGLSHPVYASYEPSQHSQLSESSTSASFWSTSDDDDEEPQPILLKAPDYEFAGSLTYQAPRLAPSEDNLTEFPNLNATCPKTLLLPSTYRFNNWLGRGSYGCLAMVEDAAQKTWVVKRVSFDELWSTTAHAEVTAVLRELIFLRLLHHDNILSRKEAWFEVDTDKHLRAVLFVMPWAGADLEGVMRVESNKKILSSKHAAKFTADLLKGLAYLHSVGVVHRDINMRNVLLDATGKLTIADFGNARVVPAGHLLRAQAGSVGIHSYRAPELVFGKNIKHHGTGVDIWAAGCVLGAILGQQNLFECTYDLNTMLLHDREDAHSTEDESSEDDSANSASDDEGLDERDIYGPEAATYTSLLKLKLHAYKRNPEDYLRSRIRLDKDKETHAVLGQMLAFHPDARISAEAALQDAFFHHYRPKEAADASQLQETRTALASAMAFENAELSLEQVLVLLAAEVAR